ncbi:hypothetical protein BDR05DRAFT_967158 [Suillus weaverae]|nr:hypothetical protein BDR05DRAFT_967158 [Suillus weaverae]
MCSRECRSQLSALSFVCCQYAELAGTHTSQVVANEVGFVVNIRLIQQSSRSPPAEASKEISVCISRNIPESLPVGKETILNGTSLRDYQKVATSRIGREACTRRIGIA